MKYRQWKKNYKKRYGVNPPATIDKRKWRRQKARAENVLASADLSEALTRAAEGIVNGLANAMRALGSAYDRAGTTLRKVADNMQPLEIRGCVFNWEVRQYGEYHYGVYEKNALGGADELRAITFSERAAEKIAEILRADQLEHTRLTSPDRIQKRQDAVDALTVAFATAYERVFTND